MGKKNQKDFEKSKIQKQYSSKTYFFYNYTLLLCKQFKNISPNLFIIMLIYFTIKSCFSILIPIFSLFPEQKTSPQINMSIFKSIRLNLFSSLEDRLLLVISIFIFLPLLIELICLIRLKKLKIFSYIIFVMSCLAPLILNICTQIISIDRESEQNQRELIIAKIIASINLILTFVLSFYFQAFFFTYSLNCQNYFCKMENQLLTLRQLVINILSIILPLASSSLALLHYKLIFLLLHFTLPIATIYCLITHFVYHSQQISKIHRAFTCLEGSGVLILIFVIVFQDSLFIQNFFKLIASTTFFSYLALSAYLNARNEAIQVLEISEIKQVKKASIYLYLLNRNLKAESSDAQTRRELIFMNFKKSHTSKCENEECFCRVKKGEELKDKLILEKIEELGNNFDKKLAILILIVYLKLQVFEIYVDSLHNLEKIKRKTKLTFMENFNYESFKNSLNRFVQRKNKIHSILNTEKILQLEQLRLENEEIIENILNKKYTFWLAISKGIIYIQEIEENFKSQVDSIYKIHEGINYLFEEYGENYEIIVLLCFYLLSVELKLVLPPKFRDKLRKLEERRFLTFSQLFSKSNENLEKLMFWKDTCALQSQIEKQNLGIISNASKNVNSVFGYNPKALIGLNVNEIMPRSMQAEHIRIVLSWKKQGSWRNIGKLRGIYCVHKNRNCFSAQIYLKILQRLNSVNLIVTAIKVNEIDYMIINPDGVIDGIGSRFNKLLGQKAIGFPLKYITKDAKKIMKAAVTGKAQNMKSVFNSLKEFDKQIDEYYEQKYTGKKNSDDNGMLEMILEGAKKFVIQFEILPYNVGRLHFKVLRIKDFVDYQIKAQSLNKQKQYRISGSSDDSMADVTNIFDRQVSEDQLGNENDGLLDCQNAFGNPSVSSIQTNEDYTIIKIVSKLEKNFFFPNQMEQKKAKKMLIIIFICCISLILFLSVIFYHHKKGYSEIQELFFADGACSDNMQLLQFMFNKQMNLEWYANKSEFQSIKMSAKYERQYVHDLVAAEVKNIEKKKTKFTETAYYLYQFKTIDWKQKNGEIVKLTTTQFMNRLIYFSKIIYVYSGDSEKSGERREFMEEFQENFGEMKRINHENLQLYLDLFLDNKSKILILIWIKFSFHLLISAILFFSFNLFYLNKNKSELLIYKYFSLISKKNVELLKMYFNETFMYFREIIKRKKNSQIEVNNRQLKSNQNDIEEDYLFKLELQNKFTPDTQKNVQNQLKFLDQKTYNLKYLFFFAFIILNLLNVYLITRNFSTFAASEKMMTNINELMDSENYILESYFQLKAQYLVKQSSPQKRKALLNELIENMNQNEVIFNSVIVESILIFHDYDDTYKGDMINLVVENVCELAKQTVPDTLIEKCKQQLELKIIENGLVIGMNFFQRTVLDAIYAHEDEDLSPQDFLNIKFKNVDYSIFYMFKMYQATQQRITFSLNQTIVNDGTLDTILFACQIVVYSLLILFCKFFLEKERKHAGYLSGKVLLIPTSILKVTKNLLKIINYDFEFTYD